MLFAETLQNKHNHVLRRESYRVGWRMNRGVECQGLFLAHIIGGDEWFLAQRAIDAERRVQYNTRFCRTINKLIGKVSKAITAQYLAGMLVGDLPPVSCGAVSKNAIKHIVETDEKLKYLVDAIKHVTE